MKTRLQLYKIAGKYKPPHVHENERKKERKKERKEGRKKERKK